MAEAKTEETVCEDRISALPDDLLVTIMLHVPIKDAVATMILSKRWRTIWMMLPELEYIENRYGEYIYDAYDDNDDEDDIDDDDDVADESKKSIWWFFEKSMELHKAPVLSILFIKLGRGCPTDADVGKWLEKAVDHHVSVLNLKLCWSKVPTILPKSLYNCQTLTELHLSHKILVDDSPYSTCLPSLRILDLNYVVYKDEASLVRLLSSCPVLEYLFVRRKKDDNMTEFSVKVPSLLHLFYINYYYDAADDDNDVVDTGRRLVIDTPALVDYHIRDASRDSCLIIKNMPCLKEAYIDVENFPDTGKFKTSLSAVVSLNLVMTTETVVVGFSTINFPRLIKLSISTYTSDWMEPFLILLKNAPILKELLVNYGCDLTPSWDRPSFIPGCLSSQLEIFGCKQYGDTEEEKQFLKFILANSRCLKTVTISVRPSFDLEKKELIIKKLQRDIPRVSTSQLLFK